MAINDFFPFYEYILGKCKSGEYNLFLHRHLGDSCVLLGLKDQFEKKYKKPIHYLITKKQEVIAWMYRIDNYTIIDFDLLKFSDEDIKCSDFERDKHIENLCERLFPSIPQLDLPFIAAPATWIQQTLGWDNFVDGWAKMLGLAVDSILPPIRYPEISTELEETLSNIDTVENIALLAPEAQTFNGENVRIWSDLVETLRHKGLTVVLNATQKDAYIRGAHNLEMSVSDVIALASRCHSVYALRSGLCDCLAGLQDKLNVYYTSEIDLKYFSLNLCYKLDRPVNEMRLSASHRFPSKQSVVDFCRKIRDKTHMFASKFQFLSNLKNKIKAKFKMSVFEIVNVHMADSSQKLTYVYLFGRQIWSSEQTESKKKSNRPIFYLKVNRQAEYTLMCIQHWLNILGRMNAKIYFVCDNVYLERDIVRALVFPLSDVEIIPSMRKRLSNIARNLYTAGWGNATYAHLTPFYHAKDNGYEHYWTIDADDTSFLLNPGRVCSILEKAEKLANTEGISALSLDMWRTRTLGRHWSFGIVYVNDNVNFCQVFEDTKNMDWMRNFSDLDVVYNLDWFFNYLKHYREIKIESFYPDNCMFIHWGNFLRQPLFSSVYIWKNGKLIFPILRYVYQNERLGIYDIAECYKISINATIEEGTCFLENEFAKFGLFPEQVKRLHNIQEFKPNTKFYL